MPIHKLTNKSINSPNYRKEKSKSRKVAKSQSRNIAFAFKFAFKFAFAFALKFAFVFALKFAIAFVSPSKFEASAPAELDESLRLALAASPEDRFATAEDLDAAIAAWESNRNTHRCGTNWRFTTANASRTSPTFDVSPCGAMRGTPLVSLHLVWIIWLCL